MYEGGNQERWETPFADVKSLVMVSLVDDGALTITLEDALDPKRNRYRVRFESAPLYRNILEEYRTSEPTASFLSWSRMIRDSGWLELMRATEPLLDVHSPGLQHYCIITEDDVLDILSNTPPAIEELGPAPKDAARPGKSRVYYYP